MLRVIHGHRAVTARPIITIVRPVILLPEVAVHLVAEAALFPAETAEVAAVEAEVVQFTDPPEDKRHHLISIT